MSEYDTREASAILKKACSDRDVEGRAKASADLYAAVRAMVNAAGSGLQALPTREGDLAITRGHNALVTFVFDE